MSLTLQQQNILKRLISQYIDSIITHIECYSKRTVNLSEIKEVIRENSDKNSPYAPFWSNPYPTVRTISLGNMRELWLLTNKPIIIARDLGWIGKNDDKENVSLLEEITKFVKNNWEKVYEEVKAKHSVNSTSPEL